MKVIQKINTKDIVAFNNYLLEKNLVYKISISILGSLSILLSVFSVVYELIVINTVKTETIIICSILFVIGIFALTALKPLLKLFLKLRIEKRKETIDDIEMIFDEAGIIYQYANHEKNKTEALPYTWTSINKVVEKKDYIYVHVNQYIVFFLIKEYCENKEELTTLLKEKLDNRYKTK